MKWPSRNRVTQSNPPECSVSYDFGCVRHEIPDFADERFSPSRFDGVFRLQLCELTAFGHHAPSLADGASEAREARRGVMLLVYLKSSAAPNFSRRDVRNGALGLIDEAASTTILQLHPGT